MVARGKLPNVPENKRSVLQLLLFIHTTNIYILRTYKARQWEHNIYKT